MKTQPKRIRNTAFWVMLLLAILGVFTPGGFLSVPGTLYGLPGLVVVLLTIRVVEPTLHKVFFIAAGGGAAGLFITLAVFSILRMLGRTPGGDGGGITVPMILLCTPLFLFGSLGSLVLLVKAKIRGAGVA